MRTIRKHEEPFTEAHTAPSGRGSEAYLKASEAVVEMMERGVADGALLWELTKVLTLYEKLPPMQQWRRRQLHESQVKAAWETALRLSLTRLEDAVETYRSGPGRRTAPVILGLHTTFRLLRSVNSDPDALRSAMETVGALGRRLSAPSPGRSSTRRQEAVRLIFTPFKYIAPTQAHVEDGTDSPARAGEDLRAAWNVIRRARLAAGSEQEARAMLGLAALDVLCRSGEGGDDPRAAAALCDFAIGMLDGNVLVDDEAVGNLYLMGAFYLDRLSRPQDCVRYLAEARPHLDAGRTDALRIDDVIRGIQRVGAEGESHLAPLPSKPAGRHHRRPPQGDARSGEKRG